MADSGRKLALKYSTTETIVYYDKTLTFWLGVLGKLFAAIKVNPCGVIVWNGGVVTVWLTPDTA
jgi:hypothetical protein